MEPERASLGGGQDVRAPLLPTTDKMDDLYPVAFRQRRGSPGFAPGDLLIEFDGDPRRGQGQFADKISQRRPIRHIATFTVDLQQQGLMSRLQEVLAGRMILRNSAVSPAVCAWTRMAARPLSNDGSRIAIAATP